jgi:hypothetical protein
VKVLLDTHAFLWFTTDDPRLSRKAVATLDSEPAELYISRREDRPRRPAQDGSTPGPR